MQTTFYPELKGRNFIPNSFIPRVSTSFSGSQDAGYAPQESVVVTGRVRGERLSFDSASRRFVLSRVTVENPGSRPCLPQPQQSIGQPPSSPTNPPQSTCIRDQNGYCVAFAAPENVIASSTVYPEPQLAELNVSEPKIALGEWKGSSWEQAKKTN